MEYKEALAYISGVSWLGSRPGLQRVRALLEKLGEPQRGQKFVHIAGTNGKGSCAAMTTSILKAAGYRTGLFTSPYLFRFNERMQIDGEQIPDGSLAELVAEIRPLADAMAEHPTEFELMTAAALLWFSRERCDIVVLEVGLGGRLDATNVIGAPEAAVIMNIGLDHTEILGGTVEQIAAEKAGIIKPGCDVVLYGQQESVEAVVRRRCEELGARLRIADFSQIVPSFDSLEGQVFSYRGESWALPLLGAHQRRNAAVVLELVELLRQKGWRLPRETVEHGLYSVSWPARFELVQTAPPFIVDGGHNPQCARSVTENLKHYFPDRRHVLLTGVLADKDYAAMYEILDGQADEYICVTPDSPRALDAQALAEFLSDRGKRAAACGSVRQGVAAALEAAGGDGMVCAVGSLYMAGAVRDFFGLH